MITNRAEYRRYLLADKVSLNVTGTLMERLTHDIWGYQCALRRLEYRLNTGGNIILTLWARYEFRRRGRRLGFSISPNVFGPGLSIAHYGTISVNGGARVGANCRLHPSTTIGTARGHDAEAPTIGDNAYIAPGARVFGPITLGNNVTVGANAVVNRSWPEDNATLVGVPARPIRSR